MTLNNQFFAIAPAVSASLSVPCLFLLVPKWHYWGTCSATTSGSGTHRCQGFIQPGHFEPKNGGSGLDNDFPFTIWSSRFFPESVNLGDFDPFHRSLPTKNTPFCRWGDIKLKIFRFPLQTTGNHHFKCLKLHCVFLGWTTSLYIIKKHSYIRCGPKNSRWF